MSIDARVHIGHVGSTDTLCLGTTRRGMKVMRVFETEMASALYSGADTCAECSQFYHSHIKPRLDGEQVQATA